MIDFFFLLIGLFYVLVVSLLFIFGLNFYYLTFLSIRKKAFPHPGAPANWPRVTVQLPVFNELYVVERLIEAAANLDYPHQLLEIQVLDDSTDETFQLAHHTVERVLARGIQIVHIHRNDRGGYKAGALAAGMIQARGEFLAVFDADFVPRPDFLKKTIPYFQNPEIAFLQTRWSHLNQDYSILTFLQSLIIDAHFMIEQTARSQSGYWFNFNGTAGVWRKAAILDAGGWRSDTLTEDLDLSYRVLLRGWHAAYLGDVQVPAELPVTITAYRRQQYRWARGSLEVAHKHLGEVIRAPISIPQKLEAILHLTGYAVHLLLFAVALLYPLVMAMSLRYPSLLPLFHLAAFFNIGVFAQSVFFLTAQQQLGRRWWRLIPAILIVSALGAGMMLNTVRAALHIYRNKRVGFERTPKFGIQNKEQNWNKKRYQLSLDRIVFYELGFAVFNGLTVYYALRNNNWLIAFYALTFCAGFLLTSALSIKEMLALARQRDRSQDTLPKTVKLRDGFPPDSLMNLKYSLSEFQKNDLANLDKNERTWEAIQRTIAYSEVFDYPLTVPEIHRYLIGVVESLKNIQASLEERLDRGQVSFQDGYFTFPGSEQLVSIRKRRKLVADGLWPKAINYSNMISRLPFVRMVAVTGALAMNNVESGADIDYLIVTEPGRLWLCRCLVIMLVRLAGMQGVTLCPNYMLSERALVFSDQSLYAAHELVQMIPLCGRDIYTRIRQLNRWTAQFLPNADNSLHQMDFQFLETNRKWFQSGLERVLLTTPGTWLERWEMERKIRKFRGIHQVTQESSFSPDWCKGHFNRHGQKTLASYASRLEMLGTDVPVQKTI